MRKLENVKEIVYVSDMIAYAKWRLKEAENARRKGRYDSFHVLVAEVRGMRDMICELAIKLNTDSNASPSDIYDAISDEIGF